jgi:hypothetical protein
MEVVDVNVPFLETRIRGVEILRVAPIPKRLKVKGVADCAKHASVRPPLLR